ncbi:MAG TPA: NTP transferase domain-containing protein [Candidatus Avidehalobacter gallistercoris]|uniref:Glucose-1-phosphate thymidylyltransferase n=1 Tax=Candidatus Avidehalobacter gallistercoris TaxID=2840694 RepID=A0A9D1HMU5_9FIRM|nr:NTP transferase domain-containing protein [Candidatus Avidehalobacter gallistercoris]
MKEKNGALCGVVLAAGAGSRLGYPNKLGGKPMVRAAGRPLVDHALIKLAAAGLSDVALVVNPANRLVIEAHVADGRAFGLRVTYVVQHEPLGIAHALSLCEDFAAGRHVLLLLVDNLFQADIRRAVAAYTVQAQMDTDQAEIFLVRVPNPQDYGVAVLAGENIAALVEKPSSFISDLAVIGLYLYPPEAFGLIPALSPSARGELEITDLNSLFLQKGRLSYQKLSGWWLDVGTEERLAQAERLLAEQGLL